MLASSTRDSTPDGSDQVTLSVLVVWSKVTPCKTGGAAELAPGIVAQTAATVAATKRTFLKPALPAGWRIATILVPPPTGVNPKLWASAYRADPELDPLEGHGGRYNRAALERSPGLTEAQDELRVVGHLFRRPRRVPRELGLDVLDPRDRAHDLLDRL